MEISVKINSTYNNTIVTALYKDRILKTISTGSIGFKKAKRSSILAAQAAGESLGSWLLLLDKTVGQSANVTQKSGLRSVNVNGVKDNVDPKGDVLADTLLEDWFKAQEQKRLASVFKKSATLKKAEHFVYESNSLDKDKTTLGRSKTKSVSFENLRIANKNLSNLPLGASAVLLNQLTKTTGTEVKANSDKAEKNLRSSSVNSKVDSKAEGYVGDSQRGKSKSLSNEGSLTYLKPISVLICGVGQGKFGAIKGLSKVGIKIASLSEITAIPHNGCKPPKVRRK